MGQGNKKIMPIIVTAGVLGNPVPGQGKYCCGSCGSVDVFMWDAKGYLFPYKGRNVQIKEHTEVLTCTDCSLVSILPSEAEEFNRQADQEYNKVKSSVAS